MNFSLNEDQRSLVAAIERLCEDFPIDYWRDHDDRAVFPHEFHRAVADSGWLGIAMPEAQGGAGLGITEAALMMRAISASGAGMSGASSVHMNIFGLNPVVVFGTEEQRQRFLPPLIAGTEKACFAVTEPDAGLDTTSLKTQAVRQPNGSYVLHGRKIWISTAQVADRMLILTRTTPLDQVKKPTQGLTLFYTALDRSKVEVREIHKLGRAAVDSNMLFIDGLHVPEEDRGLLHAAAALLGVAFLAKAAFWPLNFWLPPAYAAASAPSIWRAFSAASLARGRASCGAAWW